MTERPADLPSLPPQFRIVEKLGEGGIGVVYKVENVFTKALQAVKVLKPGASDISLQRFQREAEACMAIDHPNVAKVLDFGIHGGAPYLVMEFIDGHDLDWRLKSQNVLSEKEALPIFMQTCAGLACAHGKGIVHRDLKPSNIFMQLLTGGGNRVKLLDFGLAKLIVADYTLTQTGEVFGTPLYMSPEQMKGETADSRSDIYSLGAVMYRCLTGVPPHEGDTVFALMHKRLTDAPPPFPPQFRISESLQQVVFKCLSRNAPSRYQNADELLTDLRRIQQAGPFFSFMRDFSITLGKQSKSQLRVIGISLAGIAACALIWIAASCYPSAMHQFERKQQLDVIARHVLNAEEMKDNGQLEPARQELLLALGLTKTAGVDDKRKQLDILSDLVNLSKEHLEDDLSALEYAQQRLAIAYTAPVGEVPQSDIDSDELDYMQLLPKVLEQASMFATSKNEIQAGRYFDVAWRDPGSNFGVDTTAKASRRFSKPQEFYKLLGPHISALLTTFAKLHPDRFREDLNKALVMVAAFPPADQASVYFVEGECRREKVTADQPLSKTFYADTQTSIESYERAAKLFDIDTGNEEQQSTALTCYDKMASLYLGIGDYKMVGKYAGELIDRTRFAPANNKLHVFRADGFRLEANAAIGQANIPKAVANYVNCLNCYLNSPFAKDHLSEIYEAADYLRHNAPAVYAEIRNKHQELINSISND
ncbi:MAG TPA: protein kinase [Trichormus sp.]